jgi:hypothetical protein
VARDLRLGLAAKPPEAKETIRVSAWAAEHEIPVLEASSRLSRHTVRRGVRAGVGTFLIILVFLALAFITDFQRFFTISGQPHIKRSLNKEVLLVTQPKPIPRKADEEIDNAELQNTEIELQRKDNRIIIQAGSTIYEIAIKVYGPNALLGMDLIKEFNPRIANLNLVFAGEQLLLPVLRPETLIRSQRVGSYSLIVGSFLTRPEAEETARRLSKGGYQVLITQNRVSNDLLLHRLEINGLRTLDEATRTFDIALKNQWFAFTGKPENRKQGTRTSLSGSGTASRQP